MPPLRTLPCRTAETVDQELSPETSITWTGRSVTPDFFAEHMREKMVLHRWNMTGNDATAVHSLKTEYNVHDVDTPLLAQKPPESTWARPGASRASARSGNR